MSRPSPYVVVLSADDRRALQARAQSYTASYAEVVRAKIVLLAADGLANTLIAERLDLHVDVVSKWRQRFVCEGLTGLADRKRSGRPPVFGAPVVAEVKAMACEPPQQRQGPLSRWSSSELARQAVEQGLCEGGVGGHSAPLAGQDAIKPWRYRSWIFPRDPNFAGKAGRVLDLFSGSGTAKN